MSYTLMPVFAFRHEVDIRLIANEQFVRAILEIDTARVYVVTVAYPYTSEASCNIDCCGDAGTISYACTHCLAFICIDQT